MSGRKTNEVSALFDNTICYVLETKSGQELNEACTLFDNAICYLTEIIKKISMI